MHLDALISHLDLVPADKSLPEIDICGLTADSRAVAPGYLFAALPGVQHDGLAYAEQAQANGARAILSHAPCQADVPVFVSANARRDLALMAARFFEVQPEVIVAVTGTNGKSSTAGFMRGLWRACGHDAASLGTLGVEAMRANGAVIGGIAAPGHTTPEPVALHATLRDFVAANVSHLAVEASSHGLAQYRLDGVKLKAAGFTNLSRDHLDYHASDADYLAAKTRLFTEVLAQDGTAVIDVSSQAGQAVADAARRTGRRILTTGTSEADVFLALEARLPNAMQVSVTLADAAAQDSADAAQRQSLHLPLIGDFQLQNIAIALGLALASGDGAEKLLAALPHLTAEKGRMQQAGQTMAGAIAYVDYAHTPDALQNALSALRAHMADTARLHLVFGCGGDRDSGKRPLMGAVAASSADRVIVTDDNPRGEDPSLIRQAILTACPDAIDIGDRASAIEAALTAADKNDVVLVAGKGHEQGQQIGDMVLPFDDANVIADIIAQQSGGRHV